MDSFTLLYGVTFILLQIGFGNSDISVVSILSIVESQLKW